MSSEVGMLQKSGNRCRIYELIDALDEARTVGDLVAHLKPILSELAYYAVTGEAAVMETREEWHDQYAAALRGETSAEFKAGRGQPAPPGAVAGPYPPAAPLRAPEPRDGVPRPTGGKPTAKGRRARAGPAPDRPGQAAPTARPGAAPSWPRPGDLPASLRAIYEGTHESFKEVD